MAMSSKNEDETERTSLLASASAPPAASRPSLLNPINPRDRQQQQSQKLATAQRQTLTNTNLEEIERVSRRLAEENVPDSDSVNGLLAGMGVSDDEASVGSASVFGEGIGEEQKGDVSMQELEFLAASNRRRVSDLGMDGPDIIAINGKKTLKKVDKIRDELLHADSPELEQSILRRSLKLAPPSAEELEEESFHAQSGTSELSTRVHESTRALRVSMRRIPSVGQPAKLTRHPEIEPSEEEHEELEKAKGFSLSAQVISMVVLALFVMALLAAVVALGALAVGPPRQPMGEYKILEAQVGEDFWKYYNFYAGKDSAGSNGYITYVSEEQARQEGIVGVVTEIVSEDKMIKIYPEGDPRAIEDWMADDIAFLDHLKRQKEEEEIEKEEEAAEEEEAAALESSGDEGEEEEDKANGLKSDSKKKKTKTTILSNHKKGPAKTKQNGRRQLENIQDDLPPPRLEPFNPDLPKVNQTGRVPQETFVMISSAPTAEGPRDSVRLEGRRRFNRGLFIIDLRHMPAGCGTWPAFWLTDEANWPVNGEIDIVEGVNYQNTAKTALHSTRECIMDDVPEGSKTGTWDTSVGIPDKKTGKPDMTFRYAQNCFVYDAHQWLNQGCVATDLKMEGRSLGMPLNAQGGGVYALDWDPVNRHIRTWVFSPHGRVPGNLREALRTATEPDETKRVAPDPNQWGLPYGHFPIGEGTNCPASHFRNMRLVINLAFCGSVAGNRYSMDCPKLFKKYKTCNEWVASNPDELKEAYWKIRGVYVYEREWERKWE